MSAKARILLVDDSELVLMDFSERLAEMGFDVVTADSGEKAIELALAQSSEPFDLFILDVVMPRMDGYEVATWIRNEPRTRDSAILFLTTLADETEGSSK